MAQLIEGRRTGEFLISEVGGHLSREVVTLAAGNNLSPGAVLGRIAFEDPVVAPNGAGVDGANTGDGTLVMDETTPLLAGAQDGVYTVRAIDVTGDHAGVFRVFDPTGNVLGDATLPGGASGSVVFANQVHFELTDGATDFDLTDGFTITVPAGSTYTELDPDALDGSARAAAVLYDHVDASAADRPAVVIARIAEVRGSDLAWPDDISDGEKAAAIRALANHYIVVR